MYLSNPEGLRHMLALRLYSDLPIGYWQIRILTIERGKFDDPVKTTLRAGDLLDGSEVRLIGDDEPTGYEALSYCWGKAGKLCHIMCNNMRFDIGEEAFKALRRLRQSHESLNLWIDAICINQYDFLEKEIQVPRMATVYAKAEKVVIWLGEGNPCVRDLVYHMDHMPDEATEQRFQAFLDSHPGKVKSFSDDRNIGPRSLETVLSGIESLVTLPWFERTWTKQELWAARCVDVVYGDVSCAWKNFNTEQCKQIVGPSAELEANVSTALAKFTEVLQRHRRGDAVSLTKARLDDIPNPYLEETQDLDIINVIRRCQGSHCTDQRDYVYGLVGMSSVNLYRHHEDNGFKEYLAPNYHDFQKPADTFEDLARYIIGRDKMLSILFLSDAFAYRERSRDFAELCLPSWVPDWRHPIGNLDWLRKRVSTPLSTEMLWRLRRVDPSSSEERSLAANPFIQRPQLPLSLSGFGFGSFVSSGLEALRPTDLDSDIHLQHQRQSAESIGMKLGVVCIDDLDFMRRMPSKPSALSPAGTSDLLPSRTNMLWFATPKAEPGDIAIVVHGAYAPLLVRPLDGASKRFSYVGPIILPDNTQPLAVRDLDSNDVDVHFFESSIGARITTHLRSLLEELGPGYEEFEIV